MPAEYQTKPIILTIKRDPKDATKLTADCSRFRVVGVDMNDLRCLCAPFINYKGEFKVQVQLSPPSIYQLNILDARYKAAIAQDEELMKQLSFKLTQEAHAYIYTEPYHENFNNWYDNMSYLAQARKWDNPPQILNSVDAKAIFARKPIIFCGAGPSLAKHKEAIIEHLNANSAYVVAGGSAIRIFHEWGVKPHLCYSLDPWPVQWDSIYDKLDPEWIKDQILFTGCVLESRCFKKWLDSGGNMIINAGNQALPFFSALDGAGHIDQSTIGVSTGIMNTARVWGCSELVMVGIDLAFTEDEAGNLVEHADGHCNYGRDAVLKREGKMTRTLWTEEQGWLEMLANRTDMTCKCYRFESHGLDLPSFELYKGHLSLIKKKMPPIKFFLAGKSKGFRWKQIKSTVKQKIRELEKYDTRKLEIHPPIYGEVFYAYDYVQRGVQVRGGDFNWVLMDCVKEYHLKKLNKLLDALKENVV